MRVLLVNKHAYLMGGVDSHCMWLTRGLRERGHEVIWLSVHNQDNVEPGAFVSSTDGARSVSRALWNRSSAGAMRAAIERFDPDIVHAHLLYPQLSVAPLVQARRSGVPVVQTLHTYELLSAYYATESGGWVDRDSVQFKERVRNTATFPVRRFVHPRVVDEYIAVSTFVADAYARRGITAHVVPNAVAAADDTDLPGFEQREGIVFVGRLMEEKGVRDVLDIARRLPGISVTLAGGGPLWTLISQAADELPNLSCLGWVQAAQVPEHLRKARVLVMPSRCAETSGLAALEAFACGTPVVAFPRGGLEELVRDSGAGRLVSADGADLAAACDQLQGDRTTWQELSNRGLEAVAGRYSITSWIDRVEAVYETATRRSTVTARCG